MSNRNVNDIAYFCSAIINNRLTASSESIHEQKITLSALRLLHSIIACNDFPRLFTGKRIALSQHRRRSHPTGAHLRFYQPWRTVCRQTAVVSMDHHAGQDDFRQTSDVVSISVFIRSLPCGFIRK